MEANPTFFKFDDSMFALGPSKRDRKMSLEIVSDSRYPTFEKDSDNLW